MIETTDLSIKVPQWRPLYWEPVSGTDERLMVGVVYCFRGQFGARKTLRSDVLRCLYGKASAGLDKLISHTIDSFDETIKNIESIEQIGFTLTGLIPGPVREADVTSITELLQVACLMCSSLARLDSLDEIDDTDGPTQESANKHFVTEVRQEITIIAPDLIDYFGLKRRVVSGGQKVKFGFVSAQAIVHFSVLHPTKQGPSIRDSRGRFFELMGALELDKFNHAALITAVSRDDDPTLGARQKSNLKQNRNELEKEALSKSLEFHSVFNAREAAVKVVELAT